MFAEIRYEYAKSREMFCDRSQNDTCLFCFRRNDRSDRYPVMPEARCEDRQGMTTMRLDSNVWKGEKIDKKTGNTKTCPDSDCAGRRQLFHIYADVSFTGRSGRDHADRVW